jgi:hypothetical protein
MGRLLLLPFLVVCALLAIICIHVSALEDIVDTHTDVLASPDYANFLSAEIQAILSADPDADADTDTVSPRPVVRLRDGTRLQGIRVQGRAVNAFKGIRFAEAPVGNLRWAPPRAYTNPNSDPTVLVDAGRYGASCIQGIPLSSPLGEEDCLFLNVWTPADVKFNSSLPVGA